MDTDESEVSRLLRGDVPSDDPAWGEVSSFLESVGAVYPAVPTTALEGPHLAAIVRESRLVQSELRHPRQGAVKRMFQGTHRILAGSVAAFLIALTAGVGVASALGINPLERLMSGFPVSSPTAPAATTSTTEGTNDPARHRVEGEPGTAAPRVVPGPTSGASPTAVASDSSGKPTVADQAEKAAAKAAKEAEKEAAKAEKAAVKAAEKAAAEAKKEAEKARPTPTPSPGKDNGKKGSGGGDESGQKGGKQP